MSATFVLEKCALVSIDMAGFTRLVMRHDAVAIATMLERYYAAMTEIVERKGGRIVKFLGDGCFAVFPADRCIDAIDAAELALQYVPGEPDAPSSALRTGANVHVAQVACGEIGPAPHRRWDVFGAGVNHLFRMGGGSGLRISEPAYRQLPNDRRSAWRKDDPPAIYHFEP
jgi:adenylate cyclase